MNWVLILECDDLFKCVKITFTSMTKTDLYKEFSSNDYDNLYDFENKIIETMNFHVSLRSNIYLVCDIKTFNYEMFCKIFRFLSNRVKDFIDLHSFYIIKKNFELTSIEQ